jgi:hypothetical protein
MNKGKKRRRGGGNQVQEGIYKSVLRRVGWLVEFLWFELLAIVYRRFFLFVVVLVSLLFRETRDKKKSPSLILFSAKKRGTKGRMKGRRSGSLYRGGERGCIYINVCRREMCA